MEPPIRREERPSSPASDVAPPMLDGELHLLIGGLKEDIARYRRREAAWISLAVHAVFILLLIFIPKWLPESPVIVVPPRDNRDVTFAPLPDDLQKIKTPPKTDIVSDKNRMAQTRTPQPDRETLRKLIDVEKPGRPKPEAAPPQPPQQAAQQAPPQQQPAQAAPAEPQQTAKLQAPAQPKPNNPFAIHSAGTSVDEAIHAAASNAPRSRTSFESGHYGSGLRPKVDTAGNFDILSDTQGVDFGPYMKRLRVTVQQHWDPLIPESAMPPMMKKGRVVIEFAIMKDGTIVGMRMIAGSGDVALDRAAWGALTSSIPLDRLPTQYTADYLLIRAAFYYNPDKNDFE